jgi:hypothetical protein
MKTTSIILLLIAYLPMFFYSSGRLGDLFNDLYGILSAIGVGLLLWGEYIEKKNEVYVPLASLFSVIGLIFLLNTFSDTFYQTYKPVLLIIISTLLCYAIFIFLRRKYKPRT